MEVLTWSPETSLVLYFAICFRSSFFAAYFPIAFAICVFSLC